MMTTGRQNDLNDVLYTTPTRSLGDGMLSEEDMGGLREGKHSECTVYIGPRPQRRKMDLTTTTTQVRRPVSILIASAVS